jgi:hypothetical protein
MSQEQFKKQLSQLVKRPENATCVDCRLPQPTWASFNIGVFMCMSCAGHHRSLGTHISRVRSITLDNWDAQSVQLMSEIGNAKANAVFEAKMPAHARIHPSVDEGTRGDFIRAKYSQRAFFGQPAQGGATAPVPEVKQLSKMEQRQARLASKAAQPSPPAPAVAPVRQSSVPVPTHSSAPIAATDSQLSMFSGMNTPVKPAQPAVVVAAVLSPTPSHAPVPTKIAPARVHSASPWVSRAEHQQHQQQMSSPAIAENAPSHNLLDLSAVSDTPAVHPAPGIAMDDMFANMSVSTSHAHPHVDTVAAAAPVSSSDLMSYYAASEPFSAPARSQHPVQPASTPAATSSSSDMFSFMQPGGGDAGGSASADPFNTQAAAPSQGSSFSFLDPAADASSPSGENGVGSLGGSQGDSSAFAFVGGSSDAPAADGSDFSDLLAPAAAAAFPVLGPPLGTSPLLSQAPLASSQSFSHMPQPAHMSPGQLAASGSFLMPMAGSPGLLPHSYSQPQDLFGAGQVQGQGQQGSLMGFAQPMQSQPMQQFQPQMLQQQHQPYNPMGFGASGMNSGMNAGMNSGMNPGMGNLAPLPPLGGSFGLAPSVPQFTVQSVQATQRAQQAAAQQIADDPFAHISASPPATQQPSLSSPSSSPPKAAHECDVAGCVNKKVARGLCSKHIREGADAGANTAPAAVSTGASFNFLAPVAPQQQPVSSSNFSFLGQPTGDSSASSSFSFLA